MTGEAGPSGPIPHLWPAVLRDREATSAPSPTRGGLTLAPPGGSFCMRSIETPAGSARPARPGIRDAAGTNRPAGCDVGNVPPPTGCGARQPEGCPAPWPVAGASDSGADGPGPQGFGALAARPPVLLSDNSVVCHTAKCVVVAQSSPRTWTLRKGIVTGRRPAASRDAAAAGTRGRDRPDPTRLRPSPAGPRRRVGVVKSRRARGGCLGVIRNAGVEGCEKSGGAAQRASIPECPRRPGELKHLSTRRKRKQPRLPQ
jgi:hypothetical protein